MQSPTKRNKSNIILTFEQYFVNIKFAFNDDFIYNVYMKILHKNLLNKIISLLVVIAILLTCVSCAQGSAYDFYYFNTEIHVQTGDKKLSQTTINKIDAVLDNAEKTFSTSSNIPNSLVNKFNNANSGQVLVNSDFITIYQKSMELYRFSNGKFNPALKPLVALWGFGDNYPIENFIPPQQEQIASILNSEHIDFASIHYIPSQNILIKPNDEMQLDFGGIVKGYIADKIADILIQSGHKKGYVNIGGSSLTLLQIEELGVVHPRGDGQIITINTNKAKKISVSTSGDYQRYYNHQGKRYSHIIDGSTGEPAVTAVSSATILGVDGIVADALSTALCTCVINNYEDTLTPFVKKILNKYPSAQIYIVANFEEDNLIITNKLLNKDFTILDSQYKVKYFE